MTANVSSRLAKCWVFHSLIARILRNNRSSSELSILSWHFRQLPSVGRIGVSKRRRKRHTKPTKNRRRERERERMNYCFKESVSFACKSSPFSSYSRSRSRDVFLTVAITTISDCSYFPSMRKNSRKRERDGGRRWKKSGQLNKWSRAESCI